MKKHSLGFSCGVIYEHDDGTASFRQTAHLTDDFRVRIADVTGFSESKGGKKMGEWTLHVFGHGGELCTASVKRSDCERIYEWFRAHPDFGGNQSQAAPQNSSPGLSDELSKLASLRDAGVLSESEFGAAKRRLLGD